MSYETVPVVFDIETVATEMSTDELLEWRGANKLVAKLEEVGEEADTDSELQLWEAEGAPLVKTGNLKDEGKIRQKIETEKWKWMAEREELRQTLPLRIEEELAQQIGNRAKDPLHARMVSVSVATVFGDTIDNLKVMTDNEGSPVEFFVEYLKEVCSEYQLKYTLVGFNIKRFDLPIVARTLAASNLKLPQRLGKWDVIDLYEWPFGRGKGTLKSWCRSFGIELKHDGNGSQVAQLYAEKDFASLAAYNESDVEATANLFLHLRRLYEF